MNHSDLTSFTAAIAQELSTYYGNKILGLKSAWDLIEHLTKKNRAFLIAHNPKLSERDIHCIKNWVQEIITQHKPIQYIIGTMPFLDLNLNIEPPVLIPRSETENWCHNLIEEIKKTSYYPQTILDLCTGSGCIALALAQAFPKSSVYASDISEKALNLTQKNAKKNIIQNITILKSDLYQNLPQNIKYDLIVSNPPYITPDEYLELSPSVLNWEDSRALTTKDNGLSIIKHIIEKAPSFLAKCTQEIPQLWIEIGYHQGKAVSELMKKSKLQPKILQDLYGHDRVVTGKKENNYDKESLFYTTAHDT